MASLLFAIVLPLLCICNDDDSDPDSKPNIIFMFGDDLGFNDLGYYGCATARTPFIDYLAQNEGLIISHNYVIKICSPSRASFLTGRLPYKLGLQNGVFNPNYGVSLTRQVSLLSHEFKNAGYSTHLIGKWHLGMQAWEYTPTYRGFDTFYGFYGGEENYYNHMVSYGESDESWFYDLREGVEPATEAVESLQYGVWWERDKAIQTLKEIIASDDDNPFFMYLAWQASHSPNDAPDNFLNLYDADEDYVGRQYKQAQTSTLDHAVMDVVYWLKHNDLWENTLVVFSSDNGGDYGRGDNFPLRGYKNNSWEGGIRVPGFVTGGYLSEERKGKSLDDILVHVVDWYPTLLDAAGLKPTYHKARSRRIHGKIYPDLSWDNNGVGKVEIDGKSIWSAIQYDEYDEDELSIYSREILLDLNSKYCEFDSCGAIRVGKYKFIRGAYIGTHDGYTDGDQWGTSFSSCTEMLSCDDVGDDVSSVGCHLDADGCLFDMELDPCEATNLASTKPAILSMMKARLNYHESMATTPLINVDDPLLFSVYSPLNSKWSDGSNYLCPYQSYVDAHGYFENVLETDYKTLFPAEDDDDDDDNNNNDNGNAMLFIILLSVSILMSIFFIFYTFCARNSNINLIKKYTQNSEIPKQFNDENTPLIIRN